MKNPCFSRKIKKNYGKKRNRFVKVRFSLLLRSKVSHVNYRYGSGVIQRGVKNGSKTGQKRAKKGDFWHFLNGTFSVPKKSEKNQESFSKMTKNSGPKMIQKVAKNPKNSCFSGSRSRFWTTFLSDLG